MLPKRCIFTYSNHQINESILYYHAAVCNVLNLIPNCNYEFLRYNLPDGEMTPDQVIDKGFSELFYKKGYDTILMLDVDCIPLSTNALHTTIKQAEQGSIIGNVQRSNHINNNEHLYVAPSCICITRDVFENLDNPSFAVTHRGDIGEELTYIARERSIPVEMYLPTSYQSIPCDSDKPWNLSGDLPQYGVGTTFVNEKGEETFYHLFQSRAKIFDHLFIKKCRDVLTNVHNSNSYSFKQ